MSKMAFKLLTLINVCNLKNTHRRKWVERTLNRNASISAGSRKKELGTKGGDLYTNNK